MGDKKGIGDWHEDEEDRVYGERHAGIVIKDQKILLIHRKKNGLEYYVFPGGHRRQGEEGVVALPREIFEETNIKVTNLKPAFEFKDYLANNTDYYYLCEWQKGEKPELVGEEKTRNSNENFFEPLWVETEKISQLNILPSFAKSWAVEWFHTREA
jgi:8-oxo-dGTP pyrophosphatase MutT (NUDIX family)